MTSIGLPRDDAANVIDPKSVTNRTVKEVNGYPTSHPVTPHDDVMQAPRREPRRQIQRRQGERRQQNLPVLLDTRSGRDRRNVARDSEVVVEGDADQGHTGIDVYS